MVWRSIEKRHYFLEAQYVYNMYIKSTVRDAFADSNGQRADAVELGSIRPNSDTSGSTISADTTVPMPRPTSAARERKIAREGLFFLRGCVKIHFPAGRKGVAHGFLAQPGAGSARQPDRVYLGAIQ